MTTVIVFAKLCRDFAVSKMLSLVSLNAIFKAILARNFSKVRGQVVSRRLRRAPNFGKNKPKSAIIINKSLRERKVQ
jgi:hypothetical protein